jgi:putative lipoic acid-binding regulatory protein
MLKLKTKELVTVHSVREANARVITRASSSGQFISLSRSMFAPTRENVAAAGEYAMRSTVTKKK